MFEWCFFNPIERRAPTTSPSCPAPKKVRIIIQSRVLERAFMHMYFLAIVTYMKIIKSNWICRKLQSRKRSQFQIYYVVDAGGIVGNRRVPCPTPLWDSYIIVSIVDRRSKFGLSTNAFSKKSQSFHSITSIQSFHAILSCHWLNSKNNKCISDKPN